MRDDVAVEFCAITKRYQLFASPMAQALELLGLARLLPAKQRAVPEHLALDNLNITIARGERVGVIGRNGAGKSTLAKIITGHITPTSGTLRVRGRVHALLDAGVGFHPDFTGLENIHAALVYSGLPAAERDEAAQEIIDFVELGDYLTQPFRTYSLGMQARLGFATATAIKPEVLVIDEILGAGDAYFSAKSADRMKRLTATGVTLLMISHSMQQLIQFCSRAIWLEGGRVVVDGDSLEVVKAYERHIRNMDDARLTRENEQLFARRRAAADQFVVAPDPGAAAIDGSGVSRWQGLGDLRVLGLRVLDGNGDATWQLRTDEPVCFVIEIECRRTGTHPCIFELSIYTRDSRALTIHLSAEHLLQMEKGDRAEIRLNYTSLLLGHGDYVVTVALHRTLDFGALERAERYDLLDRSFQFRVYGDHALDPTLFRHPCAWGAVESRRASALLP